MINVLSNIVLFAGFGNFTYSFYISRKENMFENLFKEIEKCQKYHLDYVENVDQLPSDRNLLLFGTPHSLSTERIITKTYINKNSNEDRLWHFDFKDKFNLTTAAKQIVEVHQPQDSKILAFNLHKNNVDNNYQERVILHNQPVTVYGKIYKIGENGRKIVPELIMGNKQEKILEFLDKQIMSLSNKRRLGVQIGTVLLLSHFIFEINWGKKSKKTENIEKILKEMNESKQ